MSERLDGRDYDLTGASAGYKPAGSLHEDRWGKEGALVFTIHLPDDVAELAGSGRPPGWHSLSRPSRVAAVVRACFGGEDEVSREVLDDAVAVLTDCRATARKAPPWIARGKEALTEDPSLTIKQVAQSAGVDRSHFAREFERCYQVLPSLYRRRALAARTVAAIAHGNVPLGRIAHDAGFSDQAHMSRTLRSDTGLTPRQLRHLLK
jgi:AraC family transcriptional regulator